MYQGIDMQVVSVDSYLYYKEDCDALGPDESPCIMYSTLLTQLHLPGLCPLYCGSQAAVVTRGKVYQLLISTRSQDCSHRSRGGTLIGTFEPRFKSPKSDIIKDQ